MCSIGYETAKYSRRYPRLILPCFFHLFHIIHSLTVTTVFQRRLLNFSRSQWVIITLIILIIESRWYQTNHMPHPAPGPRTHSFCDPSYNGTWVKLTPLTVIVGGFKIFSSPFFIFINWIHLSTAEISSISDEPKT